MTTEQILKVYEDFHPAVRSLLAKSDDPGISKGVWQLLDMEQIPWTKGRLALLGDAAHPFTPRKCYISFTSFHLSRPLTHLRFQDQGQGAVQAIEDAASLSVVLPRGTHPEAVPERLRLYEEIRSKRAHSIQAYSREAGRDLEDDEKPEVNSTSKEKPVPWPLPPEAALTYYGQTRTSYSPTTS